MAKRVRYWRRTGDVLTDDIVCPRCGENAPDREGTPRLRCACEDGDCFRMHEGNLTWRRSPCPNAVCDACGWRGILRSRYYTQHYGNSRCPMTENGAHDVYVYTHRNDTPGPLTIELRCKLCGAIGHKTINCIDEVEWCYRKFTSAFRPR